MTHKKSVIEYCEARVRSAAGAATRDPVGYVLIWELLALLLRQNGVRTHSVAHTNSALSC